MAAPSSQDDTPTLTSLSWLDKSWWAGALRRETALDYFSHSPFYDRTCLNEQLKMNKGLSPAEVAEKLSRLPGVVYQLDEQRTEEIPPEGDEQAHTLYVIHMFRRSPSRKETTLRYYYCLDGIIYEAPTLGAVLRARLLRLGWHLKQAFSLAAPAGDDAEQPRGRRKRPRLAGGDAGGPAAKK